MSGQHGSSPALSRELSPAPAFENRYSHGGGWSSGSGDKATDDKLWSMTFAGGQAACHYMRRFIVVAVCNPRCASMLGSHYSAGEERGANSHSVREMVTNARGLDGFNFEALANIALSRRGLVQLSLELQSYRSLGLLNNWWKAAFERTEASLVSGDFQPDIFEQMIMGRSGPITCTSATVSKEESSSSNQSSISVTSPESKDVAPVQTDKSVPPPLPIKSGTDQAVDPVHDQTGTANVPAETKVGGPLPPTKTEPTPAEEKDTKKEADTATPSKGRPGFQSGGSHGRR